MKETDLSSDLREGTEPLLAIRDLRVAFSGVEVLHGIDLDLPKGETLALIGESGSGKSVLARSILGLAGSKNTTTGSIRFEGRELAGAPEKELRRIRGADISMIVQDAMAALNPMRTIGDQLIETIVYRHPDYRNRASERLLFEKKRELTELAISFLKQVGITAPEKRISSYPHQLSGGMRVRARGMSMLLVTHDLHLARDVADRVAVMYAGTLMEVGPCEKVIPNPSHPYTEGLLNAMPDMESPRGSLKPIEGEVPSPSELGKGCPFASRCVLAETRCREHLPDMIAIAPDWSSRCDNAHTRTADLEKLEELAAAAPEGAGSVKIEKEIDRKGFGSVQKSDFPVIVDARIKKHCYYARRGFFGRKTPWNVLEDVDLQIKSGEVLGLVGESGCGKSTLARLMLGLMRPTSGSVKFRDEEYPEPRTAPWRAQRAAAQMIYQDPFSCFDERMSVLDQIAEPLEVHLHLSHEDACAKALQVLRAVGLPEHNAKKLPGVMSGGQLQRAAIARAVALRPALLVCDEPVASLDVSIQAQVLALLNRLKAATHMAMLFVSHNLNVVRYLCDRAAVMYLGRIVELGPVDEVFHHPQHPYTRLLLASTPGAEDDVIRFYPKGVMPSPMERPEGCGFANRCPVACDRCRKEVPQLEAVNDHHQTACFVKHSFITDAPLPGPSQQSGD